MVKLCRKYIQIGRVKIRNKDVIYYNKLFKKQDTWLIGTEKTKYIIKRNYQGVGYRK